MPVGNPVDVEGDDIFVSFDNKGESLISFNMVLNQIEIASGISAGTYNV